VVGVAVDGAVAAGTVTAVPTTKIADGIEDSSGICTRYVPGGKAGRVNPTIVGSFAVGLENSALGSITTGIGADGNVKPGAVEVGWLSCATTGEAGLATAICRGIGNSVALLTASLRNVASMALFAGA
jgi:hypothetical protein